MSTIHVLLASNPAIWRDELAAYMAESANIEVSGTCAAGPETVLLADAIRPDILIVDAVPEDREAMESLIRTIKIRQPAVKIIALSACEDRGHILHFLDAGVDGYISRARASAELVRAVETVASGQAFLCPTASLALIDGYRSRAHQLHKRVTSRRTPDGGIEGRV